MIYRKVWADYRGRIDLAMVARPGPTSPTGRPGGSTGCSGTSGRSRGRSLQGGVDLGIPVVFANQCGVTQTVIPILNTRITDRSPA